MIAKGTPIQRKLMRIFMLTSTVVLLITCVSFAVYEYLSFREASRQQLTTIGKIVAANSTAALAFDNPQDAGEILNGLRTEKHIVAACLYDSHTQLFSRYPAGSSLVDLPEKPGMPGYRFNNGYLEGFQPVVQKNEPLGTLYLRSDLKAMSDRLKLYLLISLIVMLGALLSGYLLSRRLQEEIIQPILHLAATSRAISNDQDYSVRASYIASDKDELAELTGAFNGMLSQIELQNDRIISFNEELEAKIKAATAELEAANNELAVVNSKLLKSNKELEQFAYVASHDLQEPLRKIQTFSELAGRSNNPIPVQQNYIEKIRLSAARMSSLIKAILNYSKLSVVEEQSQLVDLNDVVRSVATDFELLLEEKKGTIQFDDLPVVKGNPLQLHQLFFNLASNSLKFTDNAPLIRISSTVVAVSDLALPLIDSRADRYYEIRFKDNGIGFDQVYADKVFAIFQRLHHRQDYLGTGIGLALCKRIVENHNGFIRVESETGKGTTFFIYLPVNT